MSNGIQFHSTMAQRSQQRSCWCPLSSSVPSTQQGDDLAKYEIDTNDGMVITTQALSIAELWASASIHENLHLQELQRHANGDAIYQALKGTILSGFPNQKLSLPDHLKVFWSVKDNLSVEDDLIVYGCRLLIPSTLRATMLSRLRDAHQGISRSQARAYLTVLARHWSGYRKICPRLPILPRPLTI